MKRKRIEELANLCCAERAVLLTGFDEAFIGFTLWTEGHKPVAIYNYFKCIESLMKGGIADREEAEEYFDYNTVRALIYMGRRRPIIVDTGK